MKHLRTVVSPANLVTLARLLLAPVLFAFVLANEDRAGVTWGGFLLGVVLASTDYFDGILARRRGTVSRWGAFLDPLADKVVVIGRRPHGGRFQTVRITNLQMIARRGLEPSQIQNNLFQAINC